MIRRPVMVALDGTDKDARAIAAAKAIGALSDSDLHFVRVVGQDVVSSERPDAEVQLARLVASLPPQAGAVATTAVRQAADVATALIDHAVECNALMVVLATRAPGKRSRALAGSVADQVLRESPRPVMLVPPGAAFLAGKEPTIARVLMPLDDSSLSFRALEFIIDLPRAKELDYVLLAVVDGDRGRAVAQGSLEKSAAWLRSRGVTRAEVVVVQSADAGAAITAAAREALVDAVVMSTRGAGGLARMILGSVAEEVVRHSELPVMLLTPRVLAGRRPA